MIVLCTRLCLYGSSYKLVDVLTRQTSKIVRHEAAGDDNRKNKKRLDTGTLPTTFDPNYVHKRVYMYNLLYIKPNYIHKRVLYNLLYCILYIPV